MTGRTNVTSGKRFSLALPTAVIVLSVATCSAYANAALWVTDPSDYRYFPPFQPRQNHLHTDHLGAEYSAIAKALLAGRGFADPFRARTGPTAWMPPMFSWLLAALWWDADGDVGYVKTAVVVLEDLALVATGILIVALARRTGSSVWLATVLFVGALAYYFRYSFQFTHDCWIVLAAIDVLIAGLVFLPPAGERGPIVAGTWGVVGGLIALTTPAVGFVWGLFALADGWRRGQRSTFAVSMLAAGLTVSPWVIRNYQVFGRFIPVKSNLAFELYQSQCLQEGGVLHEGIWQTHPNNAGSAAIREFAQLGETAFLDRKWEQFRNSVRSDPADFLNRVWNRFLEATLLYVPFNPADEFRRPWLTWYARLIYPLPFVCLVGLAATALWRPLRREQWVVVGVYLAYLMPYVVVSYYERYKFPVMGIEVMLVLWGIDRILSLGVAEPQNAQCALRFSESTARPQPALQRVAQ
jgi:hypothetical protein